MPDLSWFILWLVLGIFATYRIARMIALEDGAFDMFADLRFAISQRLGESHWVTMGIHCPLCIGLWIALLTALLIARQNDMLAPTEVILLWLGIAGVQTMIQVGKDC